MTPAAHGLGIAIVLATVIALWAAGFAVALTSPLLAGGHLIAAPVLIVAGGSLLVRLAIVQSRAGREAGQ